MKKALLGFTGLVAIGSVALFFMRDALLERVMLQRIDQTLMRADESPLKDGALHVFLCGTAAALPDANRAGPCTAILAGGEFILVDAGPASWRNLDLNNLPVGKLSAILVTHFHSDHIGELGEAITQSWIAGRKQALDIYGPPGIAQVVDGFQMAYAQDVGYRVVHHDAAFMPPEGAMANAHVLPLPAGDEAVPVFERNGVKISAFRVDHAPADPAFGYRIEYAGRVVVISGDTRKATSVAANAQGADLLVHEALASHMTNRASARAAELGLKRTAKLAADVGNYHNTPVEAAQVAHAAGVKKLVITHVFPPLPNAIARRLFLRGTSEAFAGPIVLGEDGMHFELRP
jgi:ribonuclease Z